MKSLRGKFYFGGFVLLATLLFILKLSSGSAFAASVTTIDGDVSDGCPSGCSAVTDNPDSYYEISDDVGGTVKVEIDYTCTSGSEGFEINALDGGVGSVSKHDYICVPNDSSYQGHTGTVNYQFTIGSKTDPDLGYIEAFLDMHAFNASGGGGHLTYALKITHSGGDPDISYAASQNNESPPASGGSDTTQLWSGTSWQFGLYGPHTFNFEPDCDSGTQTVYIGWAGVDYDSDWQSGDINFDLKDTTGGKTSYVTATNGVKLEDYTGAKLGTSGDSNVFYLGFKVTGGHTYQWVWHNNGGQNEMVYSIPFSSNSYDEVNQNCWTLSGTTKLNGSSSHTKDSPLVVKSSSTQLNFTHTITNNGPESASYIWVIDSGGKGLGTEGTVHAVNNIAVRDSKPQNQASSYTFPAGTSPGTMYCEAISYSNATGYSTGGSESNEQCAIYEPGSYTSNNIQGSMFELDPNGNNNALDGEYVSDCNGQVTTTGPQTFSFGSVDGSFSFNETGNFDLHWGIYGNGGSASCPIGSFGGPDATPAGYSGPYVRPWGTGSTNGYLGCGPFNDMSFNYCSSDATYDRQVPGKYSNNGFDRADDTGYDVVYVPDAPVGSVDTASCTGDAVSGWAYSPPDGSQSVEVAVEYKQSADGGNTWTGYQAYTDGSDGTASVNGISTGTYLANTTRGDVNAYLAGVYGPQGAVTNGNYGYAIPASPVLLDGDETQFSVYAIGIDSTGAQDGYQTQLGSKVADACAPFYTTGNPSLTLQHDNGGGAIVTSTENPNAYTTNAPTHVGISYCVGSDPNASSNCSQVVGSVNSNFKPAAKFANCTIKVAGPGASGNAPNTTCNVSTDGSTLNGPSGSITTPSPAPGNNYCAQLYMTYSYGIVESDGTVIDGGPPYQPSVCQPVVNEPTFKVLGSGIEACQDSGSSSQIAGWNDDSGQYPGVGSGAEYSILSLLSNAVTGVASGQYTASYDNGSTPPGTGLTIANSQTNAASIPTETKTAPNYAWSQDSPVMGGNSGLDVTCPNYSNPGLTPSPAGTVNLGSIQNGSRQQLAYGAADTDDTTLNGGTIDPNNKLTLYVTGNVYISNNIEYGGNGGIRGSGNNLTWDSVSAIPSFSLHVTGGNIYIDPGVTELDGIYTAQAGGSGGGHIYTCANGFGPMPSSDLFGCNRQLVVYGSFEADKVNLMRTFGSLRDEKPTTASSKTVTTSTTQNVSNNDGTVPFSRWSCSGGATFPGIHMYQVTYADGTQRPAVPSNCSEEAPIPSKNIPPYGYLLPPGNPGSTAGGSVIGLYYIPLGGGNSYLQTWPSQNYADFVANLYYGSTATLLGYVRTPTSGNNCPSDTEGLWLFMGSQYAFYTLSPSEITGNPAAAAATTNYGVAACLFTAPGLYPTYHTVTTTTTTNVPTAPTTPAGCSNSDSDNPAYWIDRQTCAAEVFVFSPANYVTSSNSNDSTTSQVAKPKFYSYTSLPPVL